MSCRRRRPPTLSIIPARFVGPYVSVRMPTLCCMCGTGAQIVLLLLLFCPRRTDVTVMYACICHLGDCDCVAQPVRVIHAILTPFFFF